MLKHNIILLISIFLVISVAAITLTADATDHVTGEAPLRFAVCKETVPTDCSELIFTRTHVFPLGSPDDPHSMEMILFQGNIYRATGANYRYFVREGVDRNAADPNDYERIDTVLRLSQVLDGGTETYPETGTVDAGFVPVFVATNNQNLAQISHAGIMYDMQIGTLTSFRIQLNNDVYVFDPATVEAGNPFTWTPQAGVEYD
jgi:hypothetical protein